MGNDKSLLVLLVFLVTFVKADVSCALKQYKVAHLNGTSWCVDCSPCPAGQELNPPCGSTISPNDLSECKLCETGLFSAVSDVWSCRTCGLCAHEDVVILKNCTRESDIVCARLCKSNDRYYDNKAECMPCSHCCGDDEDVRVKECEQKLGSKSDKVCAFRSNHYRCKQPTTPHSSSLPSKTYSSSTREPRQRNPSTPTRRSSTNIPQVAKTLAKSHSASLPTMKGGDSDTTAALVPPAIILILLVIFAVICIRRHLKHSCGNRKAVVFSKTSLSDGTGELEQVKIIDREMARSQLSATGDNVYKANSTVIPNGGAKQNYRDSATKPLLPSGEQLLNDAGGSYGQGSYKHGQTEAKELRSLLDHENELQEICSHLDTRINGGRDYASIAAYYGLDFFQRKELERYDKGPSRALFEWLATVHPKLTVEEFIIIVLQEAKRRDVANLLSKFIYGNSK